MTLPLLHLVQTRDGVLLAPRYDMYVGPSLETYGEYSRDERTLLDGLLYPGAVVVQAGANVGALTIPIARRIGPTGRMIAFEPQRVMFRALIANLALTDAWHVEAIAAAVGREEGVVSFPPIDYSKPGNFGGISVSAEETSVRVPLTTIDRQVERFKLGHVDLLHLDVEGFELEAIAGAAQTIARDRPLLYVEIDRPEVANGLLEALGGFYRAFYHAPLLGAAHAWRDPQINIFVDNDTRYPLASHNALCVPSDRVEELSLVMSGFGLVEISANKGDA